MKTSKYISQTSISPKSLSDGAYKNFVPAIIIALAMFFTSNISSKAQSWPDECDKSGCLEDNDVPWVNKNTGNLYYEAKKFSHEPSSPNCWVKVYYRIREDKTLCPNATCEIEILSVIMSGECFYPYNDPGPPPAILPPLVNFGDVSKAFDIALKTFFRYEVEPCATPGPHPDCVNLKRVNTATCKKIINNSDGTKTITYCETYNSCCQREAIICRNPNQSLSVGWHLPDEVPDNCHLNNDPDCKFTCESDQVIPPKIYFEDEEINGEVKINSFDSGFEIISNEIEVNFQIVNLLGQNIESGTFTRNKFIDKNNLDNGFHILILNYQGVQKTFKFINKK